MTKPDNLIASEFMTNLGTDHLAIAANGHVVGRASTAEAIRQAVPDAAHYLTAKDLAEPANAAQAGSGPEPEPNPVSAGLDAVVAQQAQAVDNDAKAKTHPQPTAKTPPAAVPVAKTPDHKHTTSKK